MNESCDSLREKRYADTAAGANLDASLSRWRPQNRQLTPLKINVVLIAGVNDDEILDFAQHARQTGRTVRFIEFMPLDATGLWSREAVVPSETVLARINNTYPLVPLDPERNGREPPTTSASRMARPEGWVSSRRWHAPFVAHVTACDSLPTAQSVTAFSPMTKPPFATRCARERAMTRSRMVVRRCVWGKRPGHGINDPGFLKPVRSMSMIGG